jgi:hypothetical protein
VVVGVDVLDTLSQRMQRMHIGVIWSEGAHVVRNVVQINYLFIYVPFTLFFVM